MRLLKKQFGKVIYDLTSRFVSGVSSMNSVQAKEILEAFYENNENTALLNYNRTITHEYDLQVIIPAYNVENYIDECIQSVLNQKSEYSVLIVIVNDGSTDQTLSKINEYTTHKNVVLIDQENKGFSGARNSGLKDIRAKYLMFLDSDDYLTPGSIEALLKNAYAKNADIVEGGSYFLFDKLVENVKYKENKELDIYSIRGYPCMKVIRSELFRNVCFPENTWFEDSIMAFLIYPKCNKIFGIKEIVYVYRQVETSISHTYIGNPKTLDSFYITEKLINNCIESSYCMNEKMLYVFLRQVLVNQLRMESLDIKIQEAVFIRSADLINCFDFDCKSKGQYKELYKILKKREFKKYLIWCKTHRP